MLFIQDFLLTVWRIVDVYAIFVFAVERYDPRQNKWSPVSPMSTRRKHLGCAVFNSCIYAVGGRDDCMELSSAERYNPHSNTWNPIVAMTSRRSGVCAL
jgi:kelch-like protein 20